MQSTAPSIDGEAALHIKAVMIPGGRMTDPCMSAQEVSSAPGCDQQLGFAPDQAASPSIDDTATMLSIDVPGDEMECAVCWAADASVIFQPCGHTCTCPACAQLVLSTGHLCPMCRGTVEGGIALERS